MIDELPPPWAAFQHKAEAIIERLNRHRAHALSISADGAEVYPRLMIPSQTDLDLEAALYPARATTQGAILRAAVVYVAARHWRARAVTVSLVWGGPEGRRAKWLVTFGEQDNRTTA